MANFLQKLHFLLPDFFHLIINDIQEELKADHLSQEKIFYMIYFPAAFAKYKTTEGKIDASKLTLQELIQGYRTAIAPVSICVFPVVICSRIVPSSSNTLIYFRCVLNILCCEYKVVTVPLCAGYNHHNLLLKFLLSIALKPYEVMV